jgi:hypothetical protein
MFEDFKGAIRRRKSKDRQHNDQKTNGKMTNDALRNTTQKTKDRAARTPLKIRDDIRCSGMVSSSYPIRHGFL